MKIITQQINGICYKNYKIIGQLINPSKFLKKKKK